MVVHLDNLHDGGDGALAAASFLEEQLNSESPPAGSIASTTSHMRPIKPDIGTTRSKQKRCMFCKLQLNSTRLLKIRARRNAKLSELAIKKTEEENVKRRAEWENQLVRSLDEAAPVFDPHPRNPQWQPPDIKFNYDRNKKKFKLSTIFDFWMCTNEQSVTIMEALAMAALGDHGLDVVCTNNPDDKVLYAESEEEKESKRQQELSARASSVTERDTSAARAMNTDRATSSEEELAGDKEEADLGSMVMSDDDANNININVSNRRNRKRKKSDTLFL